MLIGENILLALNGLRANKMRSLLTMLGIIIGIASVIAIMTLGDSISSSVTESMSSMGANNVTIGVSQKSTMEETTASGMTFSAGPRFTQMSEDDYISEEMLDDLQERYTDSIQGFSLEESVGNGTAQSGSSNILKKMNRNYTREDYLALVDKIKTAMPDISITTDLIVGFPGETEEDFEDTLSLVKEVGYSSAFTFQYSKRTGTPAATFEDQVPEEVMTERFNRLLETVKESSGCNDDLAGKTMDVLVEGKNEKLEGYLSGRLSNNMLVHFKGDEDLIGKIIDVHIDESKGFYYFGTIV